MVAKRVERICFTVEQLLLLLAVSNKPFFERSADEHTDEVANGIVYMQRRKPQLDQDYLDRLLGAIQAAPGQETVSATEDLLTYATAPPRKQTTAWEKWEETGEEITTFAATISKIPWLVWAGEPLEFIGVLTALIAGVGGDIAGIWED